jgi:hypothetical protein
VKEEEQQEEEEEEEFEEQPIRSSWGVCTVEEKVFPLRHYRTRGLPQVGLRFHLKMLKTIFASLPRRV